MVEGFFRGLPPNQWEILAIVVRVARYAVPAARSGPEHRRMEPSPFGETIGDLGVTVEALELRRTRREFMTIGAVEWAFKRLVSAREWPWRDLCRRAGSDCKQPKQRPNPPSTNRAVRRESSFDPKWLERHFGPWSTRAMEVKQETLGKPFAKVRALPFSIREHAYGRESRFLRSRDRRF
jgi:hypothetical protein